MTKNRVKTLDGSDLSIWLALDAANAYYDLSRAFTSTMPSNVAQVGPSPERLDLAIASATNRIFALELYLKACLIRATVPVPMEHDLKNLFDALPHRSRQVIRDQFDAAVQSERQPDLPWDLDFHFRLGTKHLDKADVMREVPPNPFDPSLPSLLVRNRDGFRVSRYLFASAKHNKISSFTYEHRALAILCRILCLGLENSVQQRPANYLRRFLFEGEAKPV